MKSLHGFDPSNRDASLNLARDSKAPYNDPSDNENSSKASYHDDTGDDDSTNDEPELELFDNITAEDFALVMNGSSVESHSARLALALMLLILANGEDTHKRWYHD